MSTGQKVGSNKSGNELEESIVILREMFKAFDKDRNGYIDKKELRSTMNNDLGISLTEQETEDMIKEADKNNDGKLDWEEFVEIMKKHALI